MQSGVVVNEHLTQGSRYAVEEKRCHCQVLVPNVVENMFSTPTGIFVAKVKFIKTLPLLIDAVEKRLITLEKMSVAIPANPSLVKVLLLHLVMNVH